MNNNILDNISHSSNKSKTVDEIISMSSGKSIGNKSGRYSQDLTGEEQD